MASFNFQGIQNMNLAVGQKRLVSLCQINEWSGSKLDTCYLVMFHFQQLNGAVWAHAEKCLILKKVRAWPPAGMICKCVEHEFSKFNQSEIVYPQEDKNVLWIKQKKISP